MPDFAYLIKEEAHPGERSGRALLDLFSSKAQLTAVERNGIRARRALAERIIALRFESGTLLDPAAPLSPPAMNRLPTLLPLGILHGR